MDFPNSENDCNFYAAGDARPTNFILPERSVKSFVGPYCLNDYAPMNVKRKKFEKESAFRDKTALSNLPGKARCGMRYIYVNCRIWDQKIETQNDYKKQTFLDEFRGQGAFKVNLMHKIFGPDLGTKPHQVYAMVLPPSSDVLLEKNIVYPKQDNSFPINIKNNYTLRKPVSFTTLFNETIPYRSFLTLRKKGMLMTMNVEKYDGNDLEIKLGFGAVTEDSHGFQAFSDRSRCLILIINKTYKTVEIKNVQTKSFYGTGLLDSAAEQKPLLCAKNDQGGQKLNLKDFLDITMQMILHIGNIFGLKLTDEMHYKFEFSGNYYQISQSVLNLGINGKTKYEEHLSGLVPKFAFKPFKAEKTSRDYYLHPLAYRHWATSLPRRKLELIKDSFIYKYLLYLFNNNQTDIEIVNRSGKDFNKLINEFDRPDFKIHKNTTVKELFSAIKKDGQNKDLGQTYFTILLLILDNEKDDKLLNYLTQTYGLTNDEDLTYIITCFMVEILKSFDTFVIDEFITPKNLAEIKLTVFEAFGTEPDPKAKKDNTINTILEKDALRLETIMAIKKFVPFSSEYYTNDFLSLVKPVVPGEEIEILKWEIKRY